MQFSIVPKKERLSGKAGGRKEEREEERWQCLAPGRTVQKKTRGKERHIALLGKEPH